MALPPGWDWRTGDPLEVIRHIFNRINHPNQPPSQILVSTLSDPNKWAFQNPPIQPTPNITYLRPRPCNAGILRWYFPLNRIVVSRMAGYQSLARALCSLWVSEPTWWALQKLRCSFANLPFHLSLPSAWTLYRPLQPLSSRHQSPNRKNSCSQRQVHSRQVRPHACWNLFPQFEYGEICPIRRLIVFTPSQIPTKQKGDCECSERWRSMFRLRDRLCTSSSWQ